MGKRRKRGWFKRKLRKWLLRDYEAAKVGRHTSHWTTTGSSANKELAAALPNLRARSRDLVRNDCYAAKAIEEHVSNLIGDGINPNIDTGNDATDKAIKAAWQEWGERVNWVGKQVMACRGWLESGEVLIRKRPRKMSDDLLVPLDLQILEADMLDSSKSGKLPNGGKIVQGVEFDAIDRLAAYWILPEHPGDDGLYSTSYTTVSRRVPAELIAHLFRAERPGQVRGAPLLSTTALLLEDLKNYNWSELKRLEGSSCVMANIEGDEDDDDMLPASKDDGTKNDGIAPAITDVDGRIVEQLEPMLITRTRAGKKITFFQPKNTDNYDKYMRVQQRAIAAGGRLPYELMTGDWSNSNYSSSRAGLLGYRRMISQWQKGIVVPLFHRPVLQWWLDAAQAAGLFVLSSEYMLKWAYPRFTEIDRFKEATADKLEARSGTRSMPDIIAEKGDDYKDVLLEGKKFKELADKYGLVFDSIPAQVSMAGQVQSNGENSGGDLIRFVMNATTGEVDLIPEGEVIDGG